ncbi:MAG: DMT family transporter [Aggregatilineales bacterium]
MVAGIMMAIISGAFIGLQGIFNSVLEKNIGLVGMTSFVHLTGFLVSIPLVLVFETKFVENMQALPRQGIPLPVILSGALGLVLVPGIAFALGRTNPAITFSFVMIGQLVLSMVVQQFGWFGVAQESLSFTKILAIVLIVGGVALFFSDR